MSPNMNVNEVLANRAGSILERLRDELELDGDSLEALQAQVDRLRGDGREYLPCSEALAWWEDFAEVLAEASRPAPRGNGHVSDAAAKGP